ncbi:MAG: hypothetical protein ACFFFO_16980 [Candidatus Thorarchaeota archaeon]
MPRGYEHMRDKFIAEGMSEKAAKRKAARIWNDAHPDNPVTRSHGKKYRKKRLDERKKRRKR